MGKSISKTLSRKNYNEMKSEPLENNYCHHHHVYNNDHDDHNVDDGLHENHTRTMSSNKEQVTATELVLPAVPPQRQKSPVPLRILKDLEEEAWLSGSELRTDNSSSEDESSVATKPNKAKSKGKKKSKLANRAPVFKSKTKLKKDRNDEASEQLMITPQNPELLSVDEDEFQWRPKRGSISLPGLVSELERDEIQ